MSGAWRWSDVLLIAVLILFAIPTAVGMLTANLWLVDGCGAPLGATAYTLARIHATRRNLRESDAHSRP